MSNDQGNLEAVGELLRRHHHFLISSHVRADCDGVAGELALALVLEAVGKRSLIVNPDRLARAFRFLPGAERIQLVEQVTGLPGDLDAVVILDCPNLTRTGKVAELLPGGLPLLNIDHHPDNTFFGTVNLVDPEASSACELLHWVIKTNGLPLPLAAATNLFAGILTDTGRFCFSNTTADALAAAAELVHLGADPVGVGQGLYEDFLLGQLRLWAQVVETIELLCDGRVAVAFITQEMLARHGVASEDTQEFAQIPRMVSGVEAGVLLRELPEGLVKVSLRSRGAVDVNAVAAALGGGGHYQAAGTVLPGTLPQVRAQVLAVVSEALSEVPEAEAERETRG